MAKYNGSVELISGIKQANNQDFPLVDASAVQVNDNGDRLDEVLNEKLNKSEIGNYSSASVSTTTPVSDNTQIWINPEDEENFSVPEIKDDTVNATDTWSSKKIDQELSSLKSNIDSNTANIKNNKISVDTNLEISGNAADAKVTGDAISSLKEDIDNVDVQLKSYNIINSTISDGFVNSAYSSNKLTINENSNWSHTIFEPKGNKILISIDIISTGVPAIYMFDENDIQLNSPITLGIQNYTDYEVTIEKNVKKVAVNVARTKSDSLIIKFYEYPQTPILKRVKLLEEKSGVIEDGSVTPQKTSFIKSEISGNIFNKDNAIIGLINSLGVIDSTKTDYYCSEKTIIEPNTNYGFMGFIRVIWFTEDGAVAQSETSLQGSWAKIDVLTSPTNAKYFIACLTKRQYDTGKTMIIKGATEVPSYIPYKNRKYLDGIENDNHSVTGKMLKTGLYGKKIGFLGDSYTYGLAGTPIQDWIADRTGMIAVNYGVSSSTICTDAHESVPSFLERYADMDNNLDGVVVFGGINDSGLIYSKFINVDTFKTGLCTLCEGLIEKYSTKPIIAILPPQIQVNDSTKMNATHLESVVNAEIEVYKKYSIPFVDLYHSGGFYMGSSGQVSYYAPSSDNIHKNSYWGEMASKPVQKLLETWFID